MTGMEVRVFPVGAGRVMSDRRPPPYLPEDFKQPQERPTSRARPSGAQAGSGWEGMCPI